MRFSLGKKTILLIVSIVAVISALAIAIYDKGIHDTVELQVGERSLDIANLVAVHIDPEKMENVSQAVQEIYNKSENKVLSDQWGTPEFNAYIAQYESIPDMEDYQDLLAELRKMQDVLNVDCLYTFWLDAENECYVYLVDAAYEDVCPPGCIDPVFLDNASDLVNEPSLITKPNITNTPEYGWLVSTGVPITDDQGKTVAYSAVDISMNDIMSMQYKFLWYITLALLGVTALVCFLGILLVNRVIINPINKLSRAAVQYGHNKQVFSELNISRDDEIGTLADSMVQMEKDINSYISNLEQTTQDLITAREHAEQLDRAANIDALTKVRNRRAYDVESTRLDESTQPYGIVMIDLNGLKQINDTYGHEKGNISIKTLCQIVCQTFKHSPVYRIGGDEFVVILENNDFEERDALIQSIRETFQQNLDDDSLEPWERVSAAVGCAVHDSATDETVDLVLRRADEAMYQNKAAMKQAR